MDRFYILKKLFTTIVFFIFISIIAFTLINKSPGNPAVIIYGGEANKLTQTEKEKIAKILGTDGSVISRYLDWVKYILKGDMGISYREGRSVLRIILEKLPNSVALFFCSIGGIIILSLILGIRGGIKNSVIFDKGLSFLNIISCSVPPFWVGILLIWLFSVKNLWLPSSGTEDILFGGNLIDKIRHMILPVAVIVITHAGIYARFLQEKIREEKKSYYVRVAEANCVRQGFIIYGILKNAIASYMNYILVSIPGFLGGSIIIESLFSWSGLGQLLLTASKSKDYPLVMGCVIFLSGVVLIGTFLADLVLVAVNPKLRSRSVL